jgi:tetratricopeptide (TPR) repeat protein
VGEIFRRAPSLEKALALSPNNARALYYLALVERREGIYDEEVADLQRVVEQYPQSRDARRELGIAYYQQHSYEEAVEQFEALQAIDPDDLAAHYNLAVLYRRMGMKDKAAEQAACLPPNRWTRARRLTRWSSCASIPRFRTKACPGTCIPTRLPE